MSASIPVITNFIGNINDYLTHLLLKGTSLVEFSNSGIKHALLMEVLWV